MMTWLRTAGLRLLLALGLAFSLWLYVSFRENPNDTTAYQSVPVEVEGLAPGLITVDRNGLPISTQSTVTINADGPQSIMQGLRPSDVRAFADLTGLGPGERSVPVNVATTRTGFARINFSADPSLLPFRIETEITHTAALTIEVAGTVPFSFEALAAQASVDGKPVTQVQIRGPQNRIERVTAVRATANVNQLTANYESPRPLEAIDASGASVSGVAITPAMVNVLVPIVSSVGIKRVPVIPQVVGNPASGQILASISAKPEFITLTGSSGPLDRVRNTITAPVDVSGISGVITRTVQLQLPSDVAPLANEPTSIVVTITTAAIERPFTVTLPVSVVATNIPGGVFISLSPSIVPVQISGTSDRISSIDTNTLQGTLDLAGLNPGSYTLTPTFNLPPGVSVTNQPRVTVTLRAIPTPQPTAVPTAAPTAATTPETTGTPSATAAPSTIPALPTTSPAPTAATTAPPPVNPVATAGP